MAEREKEITSIFHSAIARKPHERAAFLDEVCAGDLSLRHEVEELIKSHQSAGSFIASPAYERGAELLAVEGSFAGRSLGQYRLVSLLGSGGMGEVYLAEDTRLDRKVALKILPVEISMDAERMRRFVREAKSASALNHPNIITIHEIGDADNTHFIATEYIEGQTLREWLRDTQVDLKAALEIAIQIVGALDAAHRAGIIHRDVKPENVMVRPDGLVKLLDFGIAKLTEQQLVSSSEAATAIKSQTTPGMVIGTAAYMSPEQARGNAIDARTDIFSFGVVLYEMLAGEAPFKGENALDVIGAVLNKEPPPLSQLLSDVPTEIERIINKSLRKNRDERYQTAKDLLLDLKESKQDLEFRNKFERTNPTRLNERAESTINSPHTTSSAEYIVSGIRRHKPAFAVGLGLLVLIGIVAGYWFLHQGPQRNSQIDSIAVLPFVNEGGNADVEYLSDGMTESLIGSLSQLPNLNVKARASVFRYKGKAVAPKQIGQELNVQAVLIGRVLQRGSDLTLYVELIEAATENVLWKTDYNRPLTSIVALQSEIARDVSSRLKAKLSGADERQLSKTYTENPQAYQLYLKGLYQWNKRTPDSLMQALSLFQQAIDQDPGYAKAYAGLALTYIVLDDNTSMTPGEMAEAHLKAKAAAVKALEFDNSLAEPHAVLGSCKGYDWDFAGAEAEFKRAIELNPNFATGYQWYSELLAKLGRYDEAIATVKRAYELDPFSRAVRMNLGLRYQAAGRYDQSLELFKKLNDDVPDYPLGHIMLAGVYEDMGRYEESIEPMCKGMILIGAQTTDSCQRKAAAFRQALKSEGKKGYWRTKLEYDLHDNDLLNHDPNALAGDYAQIGDKERAFELLEKEFAAREPGLSFLKNVRALDVLSDDPHFKDLLRRVGLPQ